MAKNANNRPSKVAEKIEVENINVPEQIKRIDAAKYIAMRSALLAILPRSSPGLSQAEIREQVVKHLPEALYPDGAKSAWWAKTVQLDLEAKGLVMREQSTPLRWFKA